VLLGSVDLKSTDIAYSRPFLPSFLPCQFRLQAKMCRIHRLSNTVTELLPVCFITSVPGTLCDAQQFFNTSDETPSLPFYRVLPLLELNENLMKKGSSLPFLSSTIRRTLSDSSGDGMSKLSSLAERVPHAGWQYGLAVVGVTVALGITDWLEPYTTLRTPLFYIAIISSAWFGGMGPGLLAVVLSTLIIAMKKSGVR